MTFTHSALACFAIAVLIQSVIGWHWWQAQARHDAALQTPLVQHSNALVTQSEQLLRTTLTCQAPQCTAAAPEIHTAIDQLTTTITAYQHAASQEKSQISLVGDSALPMLQVAITRFRDTQDRDTQAISTFNQAVFTFVSSQQARHQQLLQMINQQYLHTQQQLFRQGVGVFVLFGVAILILARLRQKRVASKKHPAQNAQQDIEHLANQLANIDAQGIQTQLNNLALSPAERRIYANLSAIFEDVESQKRNADLYRQLYALIGYEIRGMTNTIQGGVRLIAQDAGENGAVMARDITLATNTLSDLADNYNRLISGGNNAPTGNVSFLPLLSELVVHLTAKTQHTQRRFDCHFGDNLPEQIEGNSTSLFWVLFLQLSNAISAQSKDHTLLNIVTDAAEDVEQTRLRFDALFLPSHQMALTAIEQAQWSNVDEKSGINDEWSKAILSHVKRVKSQWAQATVTTQDDETVTLQKLRIDIDITPKRFYRVERTLEKNR
ncbi:putative sensory box sensor histidine kinase/response regulator [Photobacterium aphoticum]|uniref:Putative sensory box sensor histidine kinase/response regulator n=1 Tax=Photobacterium aphoticum TaxID=754436 RepID=A0A090QGN3_9GAMM|nr:putative sensory box sensor histidine kinase/response regulator [Photobacterium aphoticum]